MIAKHTEEKGFQPKHQGRMFPKVGTMAKIGQPEIAAAKGFIACNAGIYHTIKKHSFGQKPIQQRHYYENEDDSDEWKLASEMRVAEHRPVI
jgi:hypothetical protein